MAHGGIDWALVVLLGLLASVAGVIIYCRRVGCGAGYGSTGELPIVCPTCNQPTTWGSSPQFAEKFGAFLALTENDRRMLRAFKIDPYG